VVLDGEALTRRSPPLEAERANCDLSFRIKQARNSSRRCTQMVCAASKTECKTPDLQAGLAEVDQ